MWNCSVIELRKQFIETNIGHDVVELCIVVAVQTPTIYRYIDLVTVNTVNQITLSNHQPTCKK